MIDNPLRGKNKARSAAIGCAVIFALLAGVMMLSKTVKPATEPAGGREARTAEPAVKATGAGEEQGSSPASGGRKAEDGGAGAGPAEGRAAAGAGSERVPGSFETPDSTADPGSAEAGPVAGATDEGPGKDTPFLAETEETSAPGMPGTGSVLLKVILGLGVVVALIFAARLVLRKMTGAPVRADNDLLSVLSFTRLAEKQGIYAVRAGDRVLLVGTSESGLHTLGELPAGDFQCVELDPGDFAMELAAASAPGKRGAETGVGLNNWLESLKWKTVRR